VATTVFRSRPAKRLEHRHRLRSTGFSHPGRCSPGGAASTSYPCGSSSSGLQTRPARRRFSHPHDNASIQPRGFSKLEHEVPVSKTHRSERASVAAGEGLSSTTAAQAGTTARENHSVIRANVAAAVHSSSPRRRPRQVERAWRGDHRSGSGVAGHHQRFGHRGRGAGALLSTLAGTRTGGTRTKKPAMPSIAALHPQRGVSAARFHRSASATRAQTPQAPTARSLQPSRPTGAVPRRRPR
jgi:hypothetical protein